MLNFDNISRLKISKKVPLKKAKMGIDEQSEQKSYFWRIKTEI